MATRPTVKRKTKRQTEQNVEDEETNVFDRVEKVEEKNGSNKARERK